MVDLAGSLRGTDYETDEHIAQSLVRLDSILDEYERVKEAGPGPE
jgi:hypothetical protein